MRFRTTLAVAAARIALKACHLTGRPGSSLPGRAALKTDPHIISALASQVRRGIIVTCGTNGKTTTNNLLCDALEAQGFRVVSNRLGANMIEGIATALATAANPLGRLDADYACLEVDEASSVRVLDFLKPDYMILLGLFRDQLDRYGEIDLTMKALEKAIRLAPDMRLIINGDDPLTAYLAMKCGNRAAAFGVSGPAGPFDLRGQMTPLEPITPRSEPGPAVGGSNDLRSNDLRGQMTSQKASTYPPATHEIRESRFCENCGAPLHYDFYHFSQLGIYRCPSCGFQRPAISYEATNVSLSPHLSFDIREAARSQGGPAVDDPRMAANGSNDLRGQMTPIVSPLTGFYNVYNILAVYSVLREANLPVDKFNDTLHDFRPQFGRCEVFFFGKDNAQKVLLNLAKNPAGFNQNISTMLLDRTPKDLVIAINDNAQDGRDVSWLWDVDFDRLADGTVRSITVSGLRALDMQLRLKYAGIDSFAALTVDEAIYRQLACGCGNLYVLVNYTALYPAHQFLSRKEQSKK